MWNTMLLLLIADAELNGADAARQDLNKALKYLRVFFVLFVIYLIGMSIYGSFTDG